MHTLLDLRTNLPLETKFGSVHNDTVYFGSRERPERNVFIDLNGFDKRFFLDCEEEDISKRVWDNGKQVYMLPEPEIIHEHGGSKENNDKQLRNEYYISYRKLIFKHYSIFYSSLMMLMVYLKILKNLFLGKFKYSL